MKKIVYLFILTCLFATCTVNRVDRYPGNIINTFPSEMLGEYKLAANGFKALFKSSQYDSIRIRIYKERIDILGEKGWETQFKIGDGEVLTQFGNYMAISRKDKMEPDFWNSTIIYADNKSVVFLPVIARDKDLEKDQLKNYLQLTLLAKNKEGRRIAIPSGDKDMLKMASKIPDDSKDSILYYVMNEDQLLKYSDKEIKNGLRFIKVKTNTHK